LEFLKAMEAEHCSRGGSHVYFVTGNYKIRTCPADEWAITLQCDVAKADMRHERRITDIKTLMEVEIVKLAKLTEVEVIAIVLYTGPMVRYAPASSPTPLT
jgi:hypothetical protein